MPSGALEIRFGNRLNFRVNLSPHQSLDAWSRNHSNANVLNTSFSLNFS
jgi:hypothetical protein